MFEYFHVHPHQIKIVISPILTFKKKISLLIYLQHSSLQVSREKK